MKSVSIETFVEALKNDIHLFDTRPKAIFEHNGIAGSSHLTLEQIQKGKLPSVPKDEFIYLICHYGRISELAGLYLEAEGFLNVFNIAGGMLAWEAYQRKLKRESETP